MTSSEPGPALQTFLRRLDERLARQSFPPGTDVLRTAAAVLLVLGQRVGVDAPGVDRPGVDRPRVDRPRVDAEQANASSLAELLAGLAPEAEPSAQREVSATFGFDEFLARVSDRSGATEDTAHRITQAVFAELRRRLPAEAIRRVTSRLPADILVVWQAPETGQSSEGAILRQPGRPSRSPLRVESAGDPLLQNIERTACLPEHVDAASAFVAATCLAMLALPAEETVRLSRALPAAAGDLLSQCSLERQEEATPFGRQEYLETLSAQLDVTTQEAERIAAAVLGSVRQQLPEPEAHHLGALLHESLPEELRLLWRASE
jgi:uncharacterized protein (DUF2267 family)